jgi:hypothetical protein
VFPGLQVSDGEIAVDDTDGKILGSSEERKNAVLAEGGTDELLLGRKLLCYLVLADFFLSGGRSSHELQEFDILEKDDEQAVTAGYLLQEW